MDFFGRKAFIPRGPAAIALKTGAPLMVMVTTREKGDRFLVRFEPPVSFEPGEDMRENVKTMMRKYLRIFEKYIRRYPDQWYVFGEVWERE
jgi:KDO2-lipid IV(A) lauroyltransferase